MKKLWMVLCLVLLGCPAFGQETTRFKQHALQFKDATLIPLRELAEWLGATVAWRSPEIIVTRGDNQVVCKVGSRTALRNGQPVKLALPPRIIKGVTYVPFRFLGEALGTTVEYDDGSGEVYVRDGQRSAVATVYLGDPPRWWPRRVPATLENYRHVTVDKCTGMLSGACSYQGQCQGRTMKLE